MKYCLESKCKTEVICHLEEMIKNGMHVFIFDHDDMRIPDIMTRELERRDISDVMIWHACEDLPNGRYLKRIPLDQMSEILRMYRLYDFSGGITVISEAGNYGSLFNYVRGGILSIEEMVEALLYGICPDRGL